MLTTNPHAVHELLGRLGASVIPEARLDVFAKHSGLDLRACTELVVAHYPNCTLYLVRAPGGSNTFGVQFRARNRDGAPDGAPTREGAVESTERASRLESFLEIDADVFAVAVGDPRPAKAAKLFAQGRLKRSPTALNGTSLQLLPLSAHQGTLRLYGTGPLAGPEQAILNRVQAGSISLDISGAQLRARLYAVGDFPSEEDEHLLAFMQQVLRSDLANLLALDSAASKPRLTREAEAVVFGCEWDAEQVLRSALYVLEARVSALLGDLPTNSMK
jgi:hypothetical protein